MLNGARTGTQIVDEQAHSFIKNTIPSLEKLFGYHFRNPDNCVLAFLTTAYWTRLLGLTSPILLRDPVTLKWEGHLEDLVSMGYKTLEEMRVWCSVNADQPLYEMRDRYVLVTMRGALSPAPQFTTYHFPFRKCSFSPIRPSNRSFPPISDLSYSMEELRTHQTVIARHKLYLSILHPPGEEMSEIQYVTLLPRILASFTLDGGSLWDKVRLLQRLYLVPIPQLPCNLPPPQPIPLLQDYGCKVGDEVSYQMSEGPPYTCKLLLHQVTLEIGKGITPPCAKRDAHTRLSTNSRYLGYIEEIHQFSKSLLSMETTYEAACPENYDYMSILCAAYGGCRIVELDKYLISFGLPMEEEYSKVGLLMQVTRFVVYMLDISHQHVISVAIHRSHNSASRKCRRRAALIIQNHIDPILIHQADPCLQGADGLQFLHRYKPPFPLPYDWLPVTIPRPKVSIKRPAIYRLTSSEERLKHYI